MTGLKIEHFTTFPRLSLRRLMSMAEAMTHLIPVESPRGQPLAEGTKRAASSLRAALERAKAARHQRTQARARREDARGRDIDAAADNAWYALRHGLHYWSRFDPDTYPRAAEARAIEAALNLEQGWGFLRLPYLDQFAVMTDILRSAERTGLDRRIDGFLGPEVMQQIRLTYAPYAAYRQAKLEAREPVVSLTELMADLRKYCLMYVVAILAELRDHDDPRDVEWTRGVLAPIPQMAEEVRRLYGRAKRPASRRAAAPLDVDDPTTSVEDGSDAGLEAASSTTPPQPAARDLAVVGGSDAALTPPATEPSCEDHERQFEPLPPLRLVGNTTWPPGEADAVGLIPVRTENLPPRDIGRDP